MDWLCRNQYHMWIHFGYKFDSCPRSQYHLLLSCQQASAATSRALWVIPRRHKEDELTHTEEILRDGRTEILMWGEGGKSGKDTQSSSTDIEIYNQTKPSSVTKSCLSYSQRERERETTRPSGSSACRCLMFWRVNILYSFICSLRTFTSLFKRFYGIVHFQHGFGKCCITMGIIITTLCS